MTKEQLRITTILICIIGLAVIVGAYLAEHPSIETLTALVAAWAGGILVYRLAKEWWDE